MSDLLPIKEKEISPNLNNNLAAPTVSIMNDKFKKTDSFLKKKRKIQISKEDLSFIKEYHDLPKKIRKEDFLLQQKRRKEDFFLEQKRREEDFLLEQKRREEDVLNSEKVMMIFEKIIRMNKDSEDKICDYSK